MADCVFCKIIKGEIPCYKVYEDSEVLAFLDINPNTPGHTVVIPKKHSANLIAADNSDLAKVLVVIKKIASAIVAGVGAQGFNLGVNNGQAAGQLVEHVHFHIIPRQAGDGLVHWPGHTAKPEELAKVLSDIKHKLG